MGHDKLRKFAENETFRCLLQPSCTELLKDGYENLGSDPVKGNWRSFFGALPYADGPVPEEIVLELGCGKGEYTIDLAGRNPSRNYIGVDIKGARLWKGAKYSTLNKIRNVAFLRTRVEFINAFFGPGEVSEIWLTFSDPQYKSPNSRLCSPVFLEKYRSFMKEGGIVHLKTDSMFLHQYARAVCEANSLKVLACTENLYGEEHTLPSELYDVQTFYEKIFLQQGYPITYISFVIDHPGPYRAPAFDEDKWRLEEGPRSIFGHKTAETRRRELSK